MSAENESDKKESPAATPAIEPKSGFSASDIFEDWSRPIGLILLGVAFYVEYGLEIEINNFYRSCIGILLAGNKVVELLKK